MDAYEHAYRNGTPRDRRFMMAMAWLQALSPAIGLLLAALSFWLWPAS